MIRFFTLFFLCIGFLAPCSVAYATEATPKIETQDTKIIGELWTGSIYSSTYRAGVCMEPKGLVHGVLILRLRNGDEDIYHFRGTKDIKGILHLKHNDGHSFKGQFDSATAVQGNIKLANGFSIKLTGTREQNVLLGQSCRPL